MPASTQGTTLEGEGETAAYSPEVGGAHSCAAGHTHIHTGTHTLARWHVSTRGMRQQNHSYLHRISFVFPPIHMGVYRALGHTRDLEMVKRVREGVCRLHADTPPSSVTGWSILGCWNPQEPTPCRCASVQSSVTGGKTHRRHSISFPRVGSLGQLSSRSLGSSDASALPRRHTLWGSPGTWRGEARSRSRAPGLSQPLLRLTGLGEPVVRPVVCVLQGHTTQDLAESDPHGLSGRWLVSQ